MKARTPPAHQWAPPPWLFAMRKPLPIRTVSGVGSRGGGRVKVQPAQHPRPAPLSLAGFFLAKGFSDALFGRIGEGDNGRRTKKQGVSCQHERGAGIG